MVKVFLGSDHAGYELKERVKKFLESKNIEFVDLTPVLEAKDDYPDIALKVCEKVISEKSKGILICGTGVGMSIAANKVPGVRAALCTNKEQMELSIKHNDANILVLSGWQFKEIKDIMHWFESSFEGGRHEKRLEKIKSIEKKYSRS